MAKTALRLVGLLLKSVPIIKNATGFPSGSCRFHPTCSSYAKEAFEKHGLIRGAGLAVWRILRCNPFSSGGFDPVPRD